MLVCSDMRPLLPGDSVAVRDRPDWVIVTAVVERLVCMPAIADQR